MSHYLVTKINEMKKLSGKQIKLEKPIISEDLKDKYNVLPFVCECKL